MVFRHSCFHMYSPNLQCISRKQTHCNYSIKRLKFRKLRWIVTILFIAIHSVGGFNHYPNFSPACEESEAHIEVRLTSSGKTKDAGWKMVDSSGVKIMGQKGGGEYTKRTNPTFHTYSTCVSNIECGGDGGNGWLVLSITGEGVFKSHAVLVNGVEMMSGVGHSGTNTIVRCNENEIDDSLESSHRKPVENQGEESGPASSVSAPASVPSLDVITSSSTFSIHPQDLISGNLHHHRLLESQPTSAPSALPPSALSLTPDASVSNTSVVASSNKCSSTDGVIALELVVTVNPPSDDDNAQWEWSLRNSEGETKYISKNSTKDEACVDLKGCYSIIYSGENAEFYIGKVKSREFLVVTGSVRPKGVFVSHACVENFCKWKPFISPFQSDSQNRFSKIMHKLVNISGEDALIDRESPQYRAACWILHDDPMRTIGDESSLVQRYALAVIYFTAMNRDPLAENFHFLSGHHECDWKNDDMGVISDWSNDDMGVVCDGEVITGLCFKEENLGRLVSEISVLPQLKTISLGYNQLEGTIPEQLYNLPKLEELYLEHNKLSGTLSSLIGNLMRLRTLSIGNNNLKGNLPDELFYLDGLEEIWIYWNEFSGSLSSNIGRSTNLIAFTGSNNYFSGTIPKEVGNCSSLQWFSIYSNAMTGQIPSTIGHLAEVWWLSLGENVFTGSIPTVIGNLTNLNFLYLEGNQLTGHLPSELGSLTNLAYADLSNNENTGTIPPSLGNLSLLQTLRLEGNHLTGGFPSSLCARNENETGYEFSSDCAPGATYQIDCPCCTLCYGPFASNIRLGTCPSIDVKISIKRQAENVSLDSSTKWYITDSLNRTIRGENENWSSVKCTGTLCETEHHLCAAASACYTFYIDSPSDRDLFEIYVNDNYYTKRILLSSNVSQVFSVGECDAIDMCGRKGHIGSYERGVFDTLVNISGPSLSWQTGEESAEYRAACWIVNGTAMSDDPSMTYFLIQRYVMALLFYKTNGNHWLNGTNFLSDTHECGWHGIKCDNEDLIREIHLNENNLVGNLFPELGELKFLRQLFLQNNSLKGGIPMEVSNMWSLEKLHLGGNGLEGTIPPKMGQMNRLKVFDVQSNSLFGSVPIELYDLGALEILNMKNNLFEGNIRTDIGKLISLEKLDLSFNFFTGSMPIQVMKALNLTELILSSNDFAGGVPLPIDTSGLSEYPTKMSRFVLSNNAFNSIIPITIGNLTGLKELMFDNNRLTGVIPTQFGDLSNLEKMSLSYNKLRGSVPTEFRKLDKLFWVHLHGNELNGDADVIPSAEIYIADCGRPSFTEDPLVCDHCSICCNSLEKCQYNIQDVNGIPHSMFALIAVGGFSLFLGVYGCIYFAVRTWKILTYSPMNLDALELCGSDSVYHFFLSRSIIAWLVVAGTISMQVFILNLFLQTSSFGNKEDSEWIYSVHCPRNSLDCKDENDITWLGYTAFIIIITTFTMKDLVKGGKLLFKWVKFGSIRCFIAGVVLIVVTLFAIFTSYFYNEAIATSDAELIVNSVILLFMLDIDEWTYSSIYFMFPGWTELMHKQAFEFSIKQNGGVSGLGSARKTNEQRSRVSSVNSEKIEQKDISESKGVEELAGLVEKMQSEIDNIHLILNGIQKSGYKVSETQDNCNESEIGSISLVESLIGDEIGGLKVPPCSFHMNM